MEIQVNDITLHYVRVGNGQPLLLLHGNGEDHTIFTDLIALLARHYTVYALDSRDHGQSSRNVPITYQLMADDVLAFTQRSTCRPSVLWAFRMGQLWACSSRVSNPRSCISWSSPVAISPLPV
ncbi:alpha/beta fold hydrolase [Lacticaseibacillus nasuensis]|uniref:alpha/beta fold hydrolase n=1 Tax=Lacticaseibacillus nasuensis TaxID=944671 RepID=UPI000A59E932|nr:alpha/beta fold hydrolase [Lacticaseibacillus nasuensis]